jgi:hypothetical protein
MKGWADSIQAGDHSWEKRIMSMFERGAASHLSHPLTWLLLVIYIYKINTTKSSVCWWLSGATRQLAGAIIIGSCHCNAHWQLLAGSSLGANSYHGATICNRIYIYHCHKVSGVPLPKKNSKITPLYFIIIIQYYNVIIMLKTSTSSNFY